MKNIILLSCLSVFPFASGLAQKEKGPHLRFSCQKYFLNERPKKYSGKDSIEVIFHFKNTGNTPLQIKSISSSCTCTVPDYTKSPLKPGESGIVKLTTSYDQLHSVRKVHAVVVANTTQKYYKLEFFYSPKDDIAM